MFTETIAKLREIVKTHCEDVSHDFYHIERVTKMAKHINKKINANAFHLEIICLVHDVCDHKFFDGDSHAQLLKLFKNSGVDQFLSKDEIDSIIFNATNLGYSENVDRSLLSIEGKIAQDSDRLDALGAVGIARIIAYSASVGRKIYDPKISLEPISREEYCEHGSKTAINHFYDKVFNIKNELNTSVAKKIAAKREKFVQNFLDQFFLEWNGEN